MFDLATICAALQAGRFDLHDEKECQAQVAGWLAARLPGAIILREHRLSLGDIPDFFIEGVVVEVKMNASRAPAIARQLARYARHSDVTSIVLLSNRAVVLPAEIDGKPLHVVSLGRAWL